MHKIKPIIPMEEIEKWYKEKLTEYLISVKNAPNIKANAEILAQIAIQTDLNNSHKIWDDIADELDKYKNRYSTFITRKKYPAPENVKCNWGEISIREHLIKLYQLKSCPFCDIENEPSYSDIDHFIPKSKSPHLALSLYNLIPMCSKCNSREKKESVIDIIYPHTEEFGDDAIFHTSAIPTVDKNYSIELKVKTGELKNKIENQWGDVLNLYERYNQSHVTKDTINRLVMIKQLLPESKVLETFGLFDENFDIKRISKEKEEQLTITDKMQSSYIVHQMVQHELSTFPLNKLKNDIAEQIGLK
jgi:5-methylcytosine-specific restriction endonuclease McrA